MTEPCSQGDRISSIDNRVSALECAVREISTAIGAANGKLDTLVNGLMPRSDSIRIRTKWGTVRGPAGWVVLGLLAGLAAYARAKGWI